MVKTILVLVVLLGGASFAFGSPPSVKVGGSATLTVSLDRLTEVLEKHLEGPLHLYYVAAVNKNRVKGAIGFWGGLALIVVGLVGVLTGLYYRTSEGPHCSILLMLLWSFGMPFLITSVSPYFFPEYAAMREIIELAIQFVP